MLHLETGTNDPEPPPHVEGTATGVACAMMPCVFCRHDIPAGSFLYWSDTRRMLSASCPACLRTVTLAAATFRRWCGLPDLLLPGQG